MMQDLQKQFESKMLEIGENISCIALTSIPTKFLAYIDPRVQQMWEQYKLEFGEE